MNKEQWYENAEVAKCDAIEIADNLIFDQIDFLYGIRLLSELYGPLEGQYGCTIKLFSTFETIDENTFHLPCHLTYDQCSDGFVRNADKEKKALRIKYEALVKKKCENLIGHFSKHI